MNHLKLKPEIRQKQKMPLLEYANAIAITTARAEFGRKVVELQASPTLAHSEKRLHMPTFGA